jgi:membrane protein
MDRMGTAAGGLLRRLRRTARTAEEHADRIELPLVRRTTVGELVRLTARHSQQDSLPTFAGNLAYNAFLAIFPFLLFLVSILKAVHATGLVVRLVDVIVRSLPTPAARLVRQQILHDVMSRLTDSPILSVFLALGSLWAVSAVARAVMSAMNKMYGVEDSRPLWARLLLSLGLSVGAALLFLAALALIVFGPTAGVTLGQTLGSGTIGWWVWNIVRWPVLVGLALLGFALVYYYAPDLEQRFPFVSVGAIAATIAWLIFSLIFSLVLNHFASNLITPLYGWFTGLIILLLYLYSSSVIVLVGAEITRVIETSNSPS